MARYFAFVFLTNLAAVFLYQRIRRINISLTTIAYMTGFSLLMGFLFPYFLQWLTWFQIVFLYAFLAMFFALAATNLSSPLAEFFMSRLFGRRMIKVQPNLARMTGFVRFAQDWVGRKAARQKAGDSEIIPATSAEITLDVMRKAEPASRGDVVDEAIPEPEAASLDSVISEPEAIPEHETVPEPDAVPKPEAAAAPEAVPKLEAAAAPEAIPAHEAAAVPEAENEAAAEAEDRLAEAAVAMLDEDINGKPAMPEVPAASEDRSPDLDDLLNRGFAAKFDRDIERALFYFTKAADLPLPDHLMTLLVLDISSLYKEVGKYQEAAEVLLGCLETRGSGLENALLRDIRRNIAYLQILRDLLRETDTPNLPINSIPVSLKAAADHRLAELAGE